MTDPDVPGAIVFTNVSKIFPDGTTAVENLTLAVPEGRLTVFVGSSGSGKTPALRMINRMVEPTSGTVTVGGADVAGVDPVALRLGIGYVLQNAGLMPHQRVIDNVATAVLSQACAAAGQWDFLFSMSPLRITGGTGCPVNPTAVL